MKPAMTQRVPMAQPPTPASPPAEASGCLDVRLPPTLECPEGDSMRFILMTPESYRETLHSGKLLRPSDHESKDSDSPPTF